MASEAISAGSGCGFDVKNAAVEDVVEDNTLVVGLSQDQEGCGQTLLFQVAHSFDEQDRALGMDTYAVSNEAGATVYGGVTSCILEGDILTVRFHPEAAATLEMDEECRYRLLVGRSSIVRLAEGLRRVLSSGGSTPPQLIL